MAAPSSSASGPDSAADEPTESRSRGEVRDPTRSSREPVANTIDRFRILRELGAGGMGVVYEAHDPRLDRFVAIKLVHRRLSEREGTRLRREAQSLARLSHPHVVQVFEVGSSPQGVFLVMELVRGQPLRRWLAARTRTPDEVLAMFRQAGEGLAAAHAAGMIHRDFKPSNVLVGDDGRARVVDFGLACAGRATTGTGDDGPSSALSSREAPVEGEATVRAGETTQAAAAGPPAPAPAWVGSLGEDLVAARLTDHDAVLGTPGYMAPEQHRGQALSAMTDQFGFCVALYEALFRVHPFGPPEDRVRRALAGALEPPPKEHEVPAHVPAVLVRGLSREPGARFPSMAALLRALAPPRRHPWLALGGGATATAAIAVAAAAWDPAPDPCSAGAERMTAAWDEQRDAARDGMLATGVPYAAATWERAEVRLEAYAEAWRSIHARTCAAGVSGELSPTELDARMRCLDERRQAMGALVTALASVDARAVQRTIEAVGELPRVRACEDAASLEPAVAPPPTAIAAEVGRVREGVATARALYLTGHHARGLALLAELRPGAEALGYPPLVAELELCEGLQHLRAIDAAAASEHLEAAYFLATELAYDRVALEAAMNLVYVHSSLEHDVAAGEAWLEHAAVLLARVGTPSQRAGYEALRGVVASQAQRHDEAVARYTRALELQTANAAGAGDPAVARTLSNLAGALAWSGRFEESIATLRRAVAIAEAELGPLHPDVALDLHNLGIILHNQDDPSAREHLERALAIREQIFGPDHLDVANTLEQLGRVHVAAGRLPEAARVLERALAIRTRTQGPEHLEIAFALAALGDLQHAQGRAAAAQQTFRRAMEMAESVSPGHPFVAYAQASLGLALVADGRWEEGAAALRSALAKTEAVRGPTHVDLMGPLQGLADAALGQGDPAGALPLAERALAIGGASELPPAHLATAQLLVARALWGTGGDDARASTLAEAAMASWEGAPAHADDLARAQRLLAEHRARAGLRPGRP